MSKYRCIVVDDETLIRKLIQMKMDCSNLGIEIVGEYCDAKSAIADLNRSQPDLIISDICMPEIDGISFAEICSKQLPQVKVIIITGYNDFEYARRSLKAGVFDYLMKPIQTDELNETLKNACASIAEERRAQEEKERNVKLLRDSYLNNLLINDIYGETQKKILEELSLLNNDHHTICVGTIAIYESMEHPALLAEVRGKAERYFQNANIDILTDPWGRIVLICWEDSQLFQELLQLMIQEIQTVYKCHIQIGISGSFTGYMELRQAYQDSLKDMGQQYYEKKSEHDHPKTNIEINDSSWKEVSCLLRSGKIADALDLAEALFDQEIEKEKTEPEGTRRLSESIIQNLSLALDDPDNWGLLTLCKTPQDLKRAVCFIISKTSPRFLNKAADDKIQLLEKIIEYLIRHISDPEINIRTLTEEFSVSSSLLSRLFKGYVGKTYSEFMSELRYWKLLSILKEQPYIRSFEAGSMIGIEDAHYLSIWFRKMSDYSLSEYRKLEYLQK